jgi:small subunit ribosomal protein S21
MTLCAESDLHLSKRKSFSPARHRQRNCTFLLPIAYCRRPIQFVKKNKSLTFPVPIQKHSYLCRPFSKKGGITVMLIIDAKDCENIDKALKKYKKKFEKSRTLLQLRTRQSFTKPSIVRRTEVKKAIYKQKMADGRLDD